MQVSYPLRKTDTKAVYKGATLFVKHFHEALSIPSNFGIGTESIRPDPLVDSVLQIVQLLQVELINRQVNLKSLIP